MRGVVGLGMGMLWRRMGLVNGVGGRLCAIMNIACFAVSTLHINCASNSTWAARARARAGMGDWSRCVVWPGVKKEWCRF